jgi:hypothetical protein
MEKLRAHSPGEVFDSANIDNINSNSTKPN